MTDDATKERIRDSFEKAKLAIDACREAADGLDDIVRLVADRDAEVEQVRHAAHERAGHYWSRPDGNGGTASMRTTEGPVLRIDGCYAPTTGHRDQAAQGLARTVLVQGCTVVQWWDSSADKRGGCSSSFVARGLYAFEEIMSAGRVQFAKVLARCEAAGFKVVGE